MEAELQVSEPQAGLLLSRILGCLFLLKKPNRSDSGSWWTTGATSGDRDSSTYLRSACPGLVRCERRRCDATCPPPPLLRTCAVANWV